MERDFNLDAMRYFAEGTRYFNLDGTEKWEYTHLKVNPYNQYITYPEPTDILPIGFRGGKIYMSRKVPEIEKVIFNPPATIVFWADDTKTVVKCMEGKEFDRWTGLSMCIVKKMYGKRFKRIFRAWCDNE